jgi:hypothetical protein
MIIIIIMELFSNLIKYGINPHNILDIGAEKGNLDKNGATYISVMPIYIN